MALAPQTIALLQSARQLVHTLPADAILLLTETDLDWDAVHEQLDGCRLLVAAEDHDLTGVLKSRPELTVLDEHPKGHFPAVAWTLEQRVERKPEVLEILEAQVQPRGQPTQHEMSDAVEGVVRGQRQTDLVSDHVSLQSDPLGRTNNRHHRFRR